VEPGFSASQTAGSSPASSLLDPLEMPRPRPSGSRRSARWRTVRARHRVQPSEVV